MKQSYFQTPRTLHDATFIASGQAIFKETGRATWGRADKAVIIACAVAAAALVAILTVWG